MKRSLSIVLVLLVAVAAWVLARPSSGDDLKTPLPFTAFQRATGASRPVFIMVTADT